MLNYPDTYELVLQEELPDIHSTGYLFRHKKSGARVAVVLNDELGFTRLHRHIHRFALLVVDGNFYLRNIRSLSVACGTEQRGDG